MREIDTSNPQQLQVHYGQWWTAVVWKRKIIWTKPPVLGFSMVSTVFGGENPWKSCYFQSCGQLKALLAAFYSCVRERELLLISQAKFHITNFNHLRRFSLSPACLGIPYWIILRGFLRFCCHQFYTTHLAWNHCQMQSKSEDSNETLRNIFLKYIKKVHGKIEAFLTSTPFLPEFKTDIFCTTTSQPAIPGSVVPRDRWNQVYRPVCSISGRIGHSIGMRKL